MRAGLPESPPTMTTMTTIAIAATFTAEPVEPTVRFWMQELQMPATIKFAPYSQVFQQLLDPSSTLSANRDGVNVLIVRLEDLIEKEVDRLDWTDRHAAGFLSAVTGALERSPIPYLVCFCPSAEMESGNALVHHRLEGRVTDALREMPGVDIVSSRELIAAYPIAEIFDPHGDRLAHVPYTPAFFTALGTMIARRIYGLSERPYKVIAIDADQTLWDGVCGEVGPLGVGMDASRRAIHEFLLQQHAAGMILCLCSRNNEEDVAAVFDSRTEMVLRPAHIAASRINWKPKSENIRSLAQELRLSLESFIFLDDDAVACADVEANCPEVLTFLLPRNPESIAPFLRNIWAFDHRKVTKEAAERTAFYRQNSERREFQMESLTLEDFLAGLGLKVQILPMASADLARAAELTQRTNQFNVTTIRRSEAGLQALLRSTGLTSSTGLVVRVKDRFGDYGLVGAMVFTVGSAALRVDTFLLSCRALGRGVEHRMLARLGEIALQNGLASVDVPFLASGKNQPALDFLMSVGSDGKRAAEDGLLFQFPAHVAAAVHYDPPAAAAAPPSVGGLPVPAASGATTDARAKAALLSSIAMELSDVDQVAAAIASQRLSRPDLNVPYVAPTTASEKQLAAMFEEVLGVERVGIHDSFFGLGGHSLLAMMLINRARHVFHVEFPITLLFEDEFTVSKAAQMVARYQKMQASPEGTTEALEQLLETSSDDEVRTLLAELSGPVPPKGGHRKG